MSESNLLHVNNLCASYGDNHVIRGAEFSLQHGEFAALLGLNGSGKTTLLRAVCGLKQVNSGFCFVNGVDSLELNEKLRARLMSYIPQRHSIVYDIAVLDVVLMGFNANMSMLQTPGKRERKLAEEALERIGIQVLRNENFLNLSEGQKQLVILARTLVQNSPIMLLDEPDSALDFVNRHMVLSKIRGVIKKGKYCGLITLHDPNCALQYCDKLLLLSEGRICDVVNVDSDLADVKKGLGRIYGNIDILKLRGHYVMVGGEDFEE